MRWLLARFRSAQGAGIGGKKTVLVQLERPIRTGNRHSNVHVAQPGDVAADYRPLRAVGVANQQMCGVGSGRVLSLRVGIAEGAQ